MIASTPEQKKYSQRIKIYAKQLHEALHWPVYFIDLWTGLPVIVIFDGDRTNSQIKCIEGQCMYKFYNPQDLL